MDKKDFKALMDGLAVSKQIQAKDEFSINFYYNILGSLPKIHEAFKRAVTIKFRTVFPSIADLIEINNELQEKEQSIYSYKIPKPFYCHDCDSDNCSNCPKILKGDDAKNRLKEIIEKEKQRRELNNL